MQEGVPSSTAALVARATVLLSRSPRTASLVPPEAARLAVAFVEDLPGGPAELRRLGTPWFRALAHVAEWATIPGLFAHYAVRKARIEEAVRSAVAGGARQVVVLGAGFDSLATRLAAEDSALRCFELDHPATQAAKGATLERLGLADRGPRLLPMDLRATTPEAVLRSAPGYDAQAPTAVVAEGLLMYLEAEAVERTLLGLRQAVGSGSTLVATLMRCGRDGRPAFAPQRAVATRWLRRKREPFLSCSTPEDAAALLERCGFLAVAEVKEPEPTQDVRRLPRGEMLAVARADQGLWLNDVQTRLNATRVLEVRRPTTTEEVQQAVRDAARRGLGVSVAGGRHAQGGQQFARDSIHLDMRSMDRVLALDTQRGLVRAQAGIEWPGLIAELAHRQDGQEQAWGIRQKQTGADRLSLGGAVAANVHGRGLAMAPIVADLESFVLVDAHGNARTCSRGQDAELFRLAVGGYGLFGIVTEVTLRLRRRQVLERRVEVAEVSGLMDRFAARGRDGFEYGDFQYATDPSSPDFLRKGILSCYRPAAGPVPPGQRALRQEDWDRLVALAHEDRGAAFRAYAAHYLATDGQLYDSDEHQLATYLEDYHQRYDAAVGATPGCEVITELYVPRGRFEVFMEDLRATLLRLGVAPIYGTVRLIERDGETVLAWAREPWACTIVNLHVDHTAAGLEAGRSRFRAMAEVALANGGSFFLTYHRWHSAEQVERGHPRMREFLAAKRRWDPAGRFQSEWHRHLLALFDLDAGG